MSEQEQVNKADVSEILSFPIQNVEQMEETQVMEIFLGSLRHPAISTEPNQLAATIIKYSGKAAETNEDDPHYAFEQRVRNVNNATALPSNTQWDELIDPSSESFDQSFSEITLALQRLNGEEDSVRDALFVLLDTRVSSLRLGMKADTTLVKIVAFLAPK